MLIQFNYREATVLIRRWYSGCIGQLIVIYVTTFTLAYFYINFIILLRYKLFALFLNYNFLQLKTIIIISGDKGSGKSTFLLEVLSLLRNDGVVVKGFAAVHEFETDSYLINNVSTNEEALILRRVGGYEKRPYHFKIFEEGVEKGSDWIEDILEQSPSIAVIDEIGGYELDGKLWSNEFTRLVESDIPLIFTVSTKHLEQVIKKWNIDASIIFDSDDFGDPNKAFEKVKKWIQLTRKQ